MPELPTLPNLCNYEKTRLRVTHSDDLMTSDRKQWLDLFPLDLHHENNLFHKYYLSLIYWKFHLVNYLNCNSNATTHFMNFFQLLIISPSNVPGSWSSIRH